jgi:uncharacterized protein YjbI with pentapeptide repeats
MATEDRLWLPPLSPKDQQKLDRLRSKGKKPTSNRTGFADRTLWDWIQFFAVLAIPIIVAVGTLYVTQRITLQQAQLSIAASEKQHQTDLQIAEDQQREATLQSYLDHMSDLLLNHSLRMSKPGDEVSQVAREWTLTTLRRLDADRNRIVLQFLHDAQLIGIGVKKAVIDLSRGDLSGDDLSRANLSGAILFFADLYSANLRGADLYRADLRRAELAEANLIYAYLESANLVDAHLVGANLVDATLLRANLANATLTDAILSNADLNSADLTNADLTNANLANADLGGANLNSADLSRANLSNANLHGARYNKKMIQRKDEYGTPFTTGPTQWPQGFDPKGAGAICVDC